MKIAPGAKITVGGRKYVGEIPDGILPADQVESLGKSGVLLVEKQTEKKAVKKTEQETEE